MINEIMLNILKRKIKSREIMVDDIKNVEYRAVIIEWLEENEQEV